MTDDGDLRQMLGQLIAEQASRGEQMDRMEAKLERMAACHQITRNIVEQHRTGWRMLVWFGGIGLAALAAVTSGKIGG